MYKIHWQKNKEMYYKLRRIDDCLIMVIVIIDTLRREGREVGWVIMTRLGVNGEGKADI